MHRPVLRVHTRYKSVVGIAPEGLDANVLTQGFSSGLRHIVVDWVAIAREWGFIIDEKACTIYKKEEGELAAFHGASLRDALLAARKVYPILGSLYRATGKDPYGDTELFVEAQGFPLTAEEYLFGDATGREVEALQVSRYYRRIVGRPMNETTKWTQCAYGQGYVAFKFDVSTDEDVYHCGAGGLFGQTFRGIKTTGAIRCTDPIRDNSRIEEMPPEKVCVSDCSYGDGDGMSNVSYFYEFYQKWIDAGKQVYFKGDLCDPPEFPCNILSTTRPHNREFIGYADGSCVDVPNYAEYVVAMQKANVSRNLKSLSGDIEIPDANTAVIEELMYNEVPYQMQAPRAYDHIKRITDRSRWPVSMQDLAARLTLPAEKAPGRPMSTVPASVLCFVLSRLKPFRRKNDVEDYLRINLLQYPYCSGHDNVEEIVWGFERCAADLGIRRNKSYLEGHLTTEKVEQFLNKLQDFVTNA